MKADIAIAGGGMVGLTLALALAQGGLDVVVADPLTPAQMADEKFDGRVSALAFASVRMMRALGLWERMAPHAAAINDIVVSDAGLGRPASPLSLHFDSAEIGEPMGAIVENRHTRLALLAAVEEEKRITLLGGTSARDLQTGDGGAVLTLDHGNVEAKLVIAAEGRDSALREAQGIRSIGWEYPQVGIVTTVGHERPHEGVAHEHFLPSGPFAILPMTGNRSSLVWTEKANIAPRMMALSDEDFAKEVALRFGGHWGWVRPMGPRWSYPLRMHLARSYVTNRFALAGDAAHTIHPIAGQGLNLGLKDVAALAETVLDAARLGLDYGQTDVLARYERWRRFDSFTLAASTDVLNRLFSNDIAPLRVIRDLGLSAVDRLGPLRRFFMRHAGGDVGQLPRLLKGEPA